MSKSRQMADLLEQMLDEQLSDEEAQTAADAFFAKRAELRGATPGEKPLTILERMAQLERRIKVLEDRQ